MVFKGHGKEAQTIYMCSICFVGIYKGGNGRKCPEYTSETDHMKYEACQFVATTRSWCPRFVGPKQL